MPSRYTRELIPIEFSDSCGSRLQSLFRVAGVFRPLVRSVAQIAPNWRAFDLKFGPADSVPFPALKLWSACLPHTAGTPERPKAFSSVGRTIDRRVAAGRLVCQPKNRIVVFRCGDEYLPCAKRPELRLSRIFRRPQISSKRDLSCWSSTGGFWRSLMMHSPLIERCKIARIFSSNLL